MIINLQVITTTERNLLQNVANNTLIYNSTTGNFELSLNGSWITVTTTIVQNTTPVTPTPTPTPTPVPPVSIWNGKFDKNYVIGSLISPTSNSNFPIPDFTGAIEGNTVEIIYQSNTLPSFNSDLYKRCDGMDISLNSLNRIVLTYKFGVVLVEAVRVLSVPVGSPTITGNTQLNVGNKVTVSALMGVGSIYQWQRLVNNVWTDVIVGANYTVQQLDLGKQIRCVVTYRDNMFQSTTVNTPAKNVV